MDFRKPEFEQLRRMVQDWLDHPEQELEASFGAKGQVTSTTFALIGKRLKNRGYTSITQEDRLNILTPENIRIQLAGLGVMQQYCRDDRLAGRVFTAMIKDRTARDANLDLDDYDVRIKTRREIDIGKDEAQLSDLLSQWGTTQKAFRLLRRWTFQGVGIRYDLSMVRSTRKDVRGQYRWVRKFQEQDITKDIPSYEVEVELERVEGDTVDSAIARLIKGVGEVLRGIQKNSLLIRNSTKAKVLSGYQILTGTPDFRGPQLKTLGLANMTSLPEPGTPNIREGFNVTDKADGLRTLGYVNDDGHLYLLDQSMNVYETGLVVEACAKSLVDGEWITKDAAHQAIHQFLLFDIFIAPGGKAVHKLPFFDSQPGADMRYNQLRMWEKTWNAPPGAKEVIKGLTPKTRLLISLKKFGFAQAGDDSIFKAAAAILDKPRLYETDGLIFTKNNAPLPDEPKGFFPLQFKWKPPKDNTIDFMAVIEKDPGSKVETVFNDIHPTSGKPIRYKVLRLHVGSYDDPAFTNPRDTILLEEPLPGGRKGPRKYRPILFYPEDFPDTMANTAYVEVQKDMETGEEYPFTEVTNEPILDKSIVEMFYDPSRAPGWRWVPKLVRQDKTEMVQRGELMRTLNGNGTAQDIWRSINEPVTTSMIRTGADEPSAEEVVAVSAIEKERAAITGKYVDRKAPVSDLTRTRPMRDFHNLWIKEQILYSSVMQKPNLALIDFGCGVAGDLQKWRRQRANAVLGVDINGASILNPKDGAWRRLMNQMTRDGKDHVLPMAFVIGDVTKNLANGEAGATEGERVILQSVLGKVKPQGFVPPYIEKELSGRFREGADVISCMFAIHYFMGSKETFDGFLQNVAENLKIGGYFIGCCFDGESVFEFLRGRDTRQGIEDTTMLWTITKKYEADEIPAGDEAFGMAIDVNFLSIGQEHREYLVPFGLLVEKMRSIGCELLNPEELKAIGLKNSTNMFKDSHEMAAKSGRQYPLTPASAEFSFLNRWFVFRRKGEVGAPVAEVPPTNAVVEKAPEAPAGEAEAEEALNEVREAVAGAAEAAAGGAGGGAAAGPKAYDASVVLQFYQEAAAQDRLRIGDKTALRWIAPGSPFPIQDPAEPSKSYPSIEHFMAAMKYKVATDKPGLADALFSREGQIHQKFIRQRNAERGIGAGMRELSDDRDAKLLTEEVKDIHAETMKKGMATRKAKFNEARWNELKDGLLREALRQRFEKDARFRKIVDAAKAQKKYLLFYTGSALSEMGGKRTKDGAIEGENKVGRYLMELADYEV